MTKLISIVTPCLNEEDNVGPLAERVAATMKTLPYDYEHIFIDNTSTDGTVAKIRKLAAADKRIKLISSFSLGVAPMLIGIFFFGQVQIFFLGVLGEYIGAIHTQLRQLPLVVELERVNFDQEDHA